MTGTGFVVFLMLAALAGSAACVRLLPRYSAPGRGRLAARTGLVVGSQVLLLSALLAGVNANMRFYSSWRDLFGVRSGPVLISDRPAGPARPSTRAVARGQDALTRGLPAQDGHLEILDIPGTRSGISARAYVYLPPQYARGHGRPFPVTLFLARPREAIGRQHLPRLAAREIAAGRLRPMLIVVVPAGEGCVDAPGGRQGETFFTQDLPAAIHAAYQAGSGPGSWSVAGPGAAGYCAALLTLRHSDRFGSGVFGAGALTPPSGDLYGGSPSIRDEYDPRWLVRHRPPPPVGVGVVADDGFAAGCRPPTRADRLPAGTWRDLPALLRWSGAHLAPGSPR